MYYDMPLMYTCQAPDGQFYVALALDLSETQDEWMYIPVSDKRLAELFENKLDLLEAINKVEGGAVLRETDQFATKTKTVVAVKPKNLMALDLPEPGVYLGTLRGFNENNAGNQMSESAHEETEKTEEITFNVSRSQFKLMVMLAKEKGITVEQLLKDILTAKASEMIADARTFTLSPEAFDKFEQDLQSESAQNPLKKALSRPKRWS